MDIKIIWPLVLVFALSACGGGGGGGTANSRAETACLDDLLAGGGLAGLSDLALGLGGTLTPAELTAVTDQFADLVGLPFAGLGDVIEGISSGVVDQDVGLCALEQALVGAGIANTAGLLSSDLNQLFNLLEPFVDPVDVVNLALNGLAISGTAAGGVLNLIQTGELDVDQLINGAPTALSQLGASTPLILSQDLFADGFGELINNLALTIGSEFALLEAADFATLINGLDVANGLGDAAPLNASILDVLGGIGIADPAVTLAGITSGLGGGFDALDGLGQVTELTNSLLGLLADDPAALLNLQPETVTNLLAGLLGG